MENHIGGREAAAVTLTSQGKCSSLFNLISTTTRAFCPDEDDKDARLKGPFIVDLLNAGSFVDQVVTSNRCPMAV